MSIISSIILAIIVAPYFSEPLYIINLAVWTNNAEFCPSSYGNISDDTKLATVTLTQMEALKLILL
jgi:hypothetical protein